MINSQTARGAAQPQKPSYDQMPASMHNLRAYVPYVLIAPEPGKTKWRKQAINPSTLKAFDWNNPADFVTLKEADQILKANPKFDGIGICFAGTPIIDGRYLVSIDLDGIYDGDQRIKAHHLSLLNGIQGFVETSISGSGKHIFVLADEPLQDFKNHELGVELFASNGFIALTGDVDTQFSKALDGPSLDASHLLLYQRIWKQEYDAFATESERDPNMSPDELHDLVMSVRPPDPGRDTWIRIGMICHHQTRGDLDGLDAWRDYSLQGCEHPEIYGSPASESELQYQWHSFKKSPAAGRSVTHRTLRYWAKQDAPVDQDVFNDAEYDLEETTATEYVIDGFIAEGIFVLSGQSGIGKTTLLLPLAALAAHICAVDHPLKPNLRRPVLYLTEDKKQAVRILSGLRKHCGVNMSATEMNQWFKIRETHRMNKDEIAQLIRKFADENKMYMKDVNGNDVLIPVLIIADTVAATLDLDDENNNSEVSKFISKIKSACSDTGASLWLIAHISKAMNRADVNDMSARGASAFGADANGTGFVIAGEGGDEGKRFLILGKKRYEVNFNEVSFTTQKYDLLVKNRLGQTLSESYRIGSIEKSSEQNRKASSQQAQLTRDENIVLDAIRQCGSIYLPKTLIGTLTGMASGNGYQRLGGILAKLVADQVLEVMSTKDAKANGANVSANTKEVYRIKPGPDFKVHE
jgi:RecA-family ATPase